MNTHIYTDYKAHLSQDKKLALLLDVVEPYQLIRRSNVFMRLCASIMSQQLSTKAAEVIYKRFLSLYEGTEPTPIQILHTEYDTLKSIGLSNAKTKYVQNVAQFFLDNQLKDNTFETLSNVEVINLLTQIKGVGNWTVEMLLMFTLGREDVFAIDDLGIKQAMIKLYEMDTQDKKQLKEQMLQLSAKWAPYRTYACFYLWKYKDENK